MSKAVAISIEGNTFKVVHAALRGKKISVTRASVYPREQLDHFLSREKARDFTVNVDFREMYQDTVSIPPVKKGLVPSLILSELKKKHRSEGEFVAAWFTLGRRTVEGRMMDDYYVFYVDRREVDELTGRFLAHGKMIRALYPNILPVLQILPREEEPYLCMFETGERKYLFLVRDGDILFSRSGQAVSEDIVDFDIQNINMTVNYCRQALRIDPGKVMFAGTAGSTFAASAAAVVPVATLHKPEHLVTDKETYMDFLIPIASLVRGGIPSMVAPDYRLFYRVSGALRFATASLLVLSALTAGFLGFAAFEYRTLSSRFAALSLKERELKGVLDAYREARQELDRARPMIDFMNRMNEAPSAARFLYGLSLLEPDGMNITTFDISAAGTRNLKLKLAGRMQLDSLYQAQKSFDAALKKIRGIDGITAADGELAVRDGSFEIAATYSGEGDR